MCKKVTLIWALMCMFVMTSLAANKRFTLVIDPGHGGHDAGALGAISKEKNINLAVALRFGKYVEQNLPEVRVIYTARRMSSSRSMSVRISPTVPTPIYLSPCTPMPCRQER